MSDYGRCTSCSAHLYPNDEFCGRCGAHRRPRAESAAPAARPRTQTTPWVALGAVVLLVVGALLGVQTGLVPRGVLDPVAVERAVEKHFEQVLEGDVGVTCPNRIWRQKGRITDCSARLPSGRSADVYVEQVDTGGHFRFQADTTALAAEVQEKIDRDAVALQAEIERDTEQLIADLPRITFVDTCKVGYNEQACQCAYVQLGSTAERDAALVELLAMQPTDATLDLLEACGAPTD